MKILLNNRETSYDAEAMTVRELLEHNRFTFPMIVVKVNGELIRKERFDQVSVHDGDHVQALHLMSGG